MYVFFNKFYDIKKVIGMCCCQAVSRGGGGGCYLAHVFYNDEILFYSFLSLLSFSFVLGVFFVERCSFFCVLRKGRD